MTDEQRAHIERALSTLVNLQPIIANGLLDRRQLAFIDPHHEIAMEALEAVLIAERVEPVQEPVAKVELMTTGENAGLATRIVEIDDHLRERLRPGQLLYTAPPQRQPLTDEKISDLWCEVSNTDFVTADTHVFARAIERAHGIGEQDAQV